MSIKDSEMSEKCSNVLQLTAVGEVGCFIGGLSVQFALVVGEWKWSAVFNELEQSARTRRGIKFTIEVEPTIA